MTDIKNYVPKIEEVLKMRIREAEECKEPSQEGMQAFGQWLKSYGYKDTNTTTFEALCRYGAGEVEKINRKGMMLKGRPGVGKTFGCELLASRFRWSVIPAQDFVDAWKMMSPDDFETFVMCAGNYDLHPKPQTIVIDDIGTETCPANRYGETLNVIVRVLDMRYKMWIDTGARTIITTNLEDREIIARYGMRLDDRFEEMLRWFVCGGVSMRRAM